MKQKINYHLYLCTDQKLMTTKTLEEAVEQAILGGCGVVQLREKEASGREFYETAVRIKQVTDQYHVPLIINDRVDIAMAVDAAGVHVGQSDLSVSVVRKLIGEDKIIGVSTANVVEAIKAEKEGADYIGVGAMFATSTKNNTRSVSMDTLKEIRKNIKIPMVVIGGINQKNAPSFTGIGINGFAVVSAVIAQPDIQKAAREFVNIEL